MSQIEGRAESAPTSGASARAVVSWLLAGSLATSAVPARADWQYTKWGMSPIEVIEASGGTAKVNTKATKSSNGDIDKVDGTYTTGDYKFTALFQFDASDKLTLVKLLLHKPSTCDQVRDDLIAKYGGPARVKASSLIKEAAWLLAAENTRISLTDMGPGTLCSLEYDRLSGAGRNGL